MKQLITLLLAAIVGNVSAQSTTAANVYPSNLEENMYFEKYDDGAASIKGLHFLVLSDGDNSKDKTPAFEVSLYLMPEGKSSREDLIMVKTYQLQGIFHMGSHEFKNETVSLAGKDIAPGNYRLGIWVNSNVAFSEDTSDNATLFKGSLQISSNPVSLREVLPVKLEMEEKEDDWGDW